MMRLKCGGSLRGSLTGNGAEGLRSASVGSAGKRSTGPFLTKALGTGMLIFMRGLIWKNKKIF